MFKKITISNIIEVAIIIFLMYLTAMLLIPIGKSVENINPTSVSIEITGKVSDVEKINEKIKDIEYVVRDAQYKYIDTMTNKVYGIIAIIGVFFTVFVLVVSIYQYFKSKTYEEKIKQMEIEIEERNNEFQKSLNEYNDELRVLITANVVFARAQNYLLSSEYSSAIKEFEALLQMGENNTEIKSVFDLDQIKRSLVQSYTKIQNYQKAAKTIAAVIDTDVVNFHDKNYTNNYFEYCKLMFIDAEQSKKLEKFLNVETVLEKIVLAFERDEINEIELEADALEYYGKTKVHIGLLYSKTNEKNRAMVYLSEGLGNEFLDSDFMLYDVAIQILNNLYLSTVNLIESTEYDDYFSNLNRLVAFVGRKCYFNLKSSSMELLKIKDNISLLKKNIINFIDLYNSEYEDEAIKQAARKLYLYIYANAEMREELKEIKGYEDAITIGSDLHNNDEIVERNVGIDPFKDEEINAFA